MRSAKTPNWLGSDLAPAAENPEETAPGTVTTFDAFAWFAHAAPPAPPQPGHTPRSRDERLAYHSKFVTVRTPAIDNLARSVRTLMILGRHQNINARPSLIATGPATTGKTTALLEVGCTCHLAHTRRAPGRDAGVPVAYVLVPPGATAKTLAGEFTRYLSIPLTTAQITTAVCHTYTAAGVKLVLIDEIHRLNPRTSSGSEAADLMKDLTERIGATFVYAGINVTASTVFTGVRGAQLAGRASLTRAQCGVGLSQVLCEARAIGTHTAGYLPCAALPTTRTRRRPRVVRDN
ncbi:TniB family NTP-binding protein [Streptomyces sp. NPDC004579]|uniref:TniB family NTP-binding protein n=1 Tax=Streptomyces sp. NPDC004579 TaxID=3154667 RepID=UPI0033BB7BE6